MKLFSKEKPFIIDILIQWLSICITSFCLYYDHKYAVGIFEENYSVLILWLIVFVIVIFILKKRNLIQNDNFLSLISTFLATFLLFVPLFLLSIALLLVAMITIITPWFMPLVILAAIPIVYTWLMLLPPLTQYQDKFRADLVCFSISYLLFLLFLHEYRNSFLLWGGILIFFIGTFINTRFNVIFRKKKKIVQKPSISTETLPLKSPILVTNTSSPTITPLLGAIITGDIALVQTALTDHPEELNTAYAQNGNTPLHVAALNGYTDIIRLLLAQPGIDTTRTNNEGKTALDLAHEKGFEEIVQLLENR